MCMFILSMGHSVSLYHNFVFPGPFRGSTISGTWVVWYFCASSVWVKFRSLFGTDMHVSIYNLSPWVSDYGNVNIQGTCICLFSFEETGTYSYRYNLVDIFYVG